MVSVAEVDGLVIGGEVPSKTCRNCGCNGEWPGQPCPRCRAGIFDPVPLRLLAEHLRDRTWLDLRTEDGPIQRVRIFEIIVRAEGDDVRLFQQWFDDDHSFQKRWFAIDSESIWKVGPTTCARASDVTPYQADLQAATGTHLDKSQQQELMVTTLRSARFLWSLKLDELRDTSNLEQITARYACLIVLYEMSDLEPKQICEALGYLSVQPLVSARCDIGGRHHPVQERIDAAKRLGGLVDDRMPFRCRTTRVFPANYRPVLGR